MMNHKLFVTIAALVLLGVSLAASASECVGCRGDELIQSIENMEEKRKCWFSADNRKVLPEVKVAVMAGVGSVLEGLRISTNLSSSLRCMNIILSKICLSLNKVAVSECMMANMKSIAKSYRKVEACNGKPLDAAKLDLMFKVISGAIVGWREIHSEC